MLEKQQQQAYLFLELRKNYCADRIALDYSVFVSFHPMLYVLL